MWPYPWTHVGTPSHLGHMDRVAATMPSQGHAGAAQEAPDIGQWEGQDVPLVRPSSCNVKGGIPSSRRYLPTYLPRAHSHPRLPILWCVRPEPATHWLWVQCADVGAWLSLAPPPMQRFVVCCARFPGLRHPVAVVAWYLYSCRGCGRQRASPACLVAPRWCATPRPVRSLSVLQSAFPSPWCVPPPQGLSPPALLGCCAGHVEVGRETSSLCLPLAPAEARALSEPRVVPVRGPAMGLSLAGPSGFCLALRALRWFGACGPGR